MGVSAQQSRINVAIAVWEWGAYYSDLRLTRAHLRPTCTNTAPVHAKAAGLYMICTICKHAAEAKGFGDALMLDYRGYRRRNHRRQRLPGRQRRDPHAEARLLPQRHHPANGDRPRAGKRGIEVIERHITPRGAADAQEIFVTGTAAEITPVRAIDDLHYQLGPITRQLIDDYHGLTRGHAKAA